MIQPNITHMPCDLNQQRKRADARRDALALALRRRHGHRSLLERVLRRRPRAVEVAADVARHAEGEDVFHAFSV